MIATLTLLQLGSALGVFGTAVTLVLSVLAQRLSQRSNKHDASLAMIEASQKIITDTNAITDAANAGLRADNAKLEADNEKLHGELRAANDEVSSLRNQIDRQGRAKRPGGRSD